LITLFDFFNRNSLCLEFGDNRVGLLLIGDFKFLAVLEQ